MNDLDLVDTTTARIPSVYAAAKRAISQCSKIDECKDWTDKAAALASYAKQAKDEQLEKMAKRIRARATRRAGELLKQIEPAHGANQNIRVGTDPKVTRKQAAEDAGLSERQAKNALRTANVPEDVFEEMVEGDANVTAIAEAGTNKSNVRGSGVDAKALIAAMKTFKSKLAKINLDDAIEGLSLEQKMEVLSLIHSLDAKLDEIASRI